MKDMVNQHNSTAGDNIITVLSIYDWDTWMISTAIKP